MSTIKNNHAYIMLADGFEEMEALTPIDFLRRGGVYVTLVAVKGNTTMVKGSHGVNIQADDILSHLENEIKNAQNSIIILPGGMPGATNLVSSVPLQKILTDYHKRQCLIGAICAAPARVLAPLNILKGKRFTCYPSMEKEIADGLFSEAPVVQDNHIITSRGVATAPLFAKTILHILTDEKTANEVWSSMLYDICET